MVNGHDRSLIHCYVSNSYDCVRQVLLVGSVLEKIVKEIVL